MLDKFHLKGNASFTIREGWLAKGLRNVAKDSDVFLRENATEILGVGSAMVKSIRFWLQACGLCSEPKSGRRSQSLTELGKVILENDPYFENLFTLYIIHYHLAMNTQMTTVWYLLFNYLDVSHFTRESMIDTLMSSFKELTNKEFAASSFEDDCGVALKTYVADTQKHVSPEDNMQCPLTALDLFRKSTRNMYDRTTPPAEKLHSYAVFYVMLKSLDDDHVSFDRLLTDRGNVGKIFHLNAYRLNAYLDDLQAHGLLNVQRTAGLNMVYPNKEYRPIDIVKQYYRR